MAKHRSSGFGFLAEALRHRPSSRNDVMMTAWISLIVAGLLEVGWAIGLKYTFGFTRLWPTVATLIGMLASFALLSHSLKTIPVGTAYPVWTGIGAVGTAILGMLLFDESHEIARIVFILMIVAGVVGLKITSTAP